MSQNKDAAQGVIATGFSEELACRSGQIKQELLKKKARSALRTIAEKYQSTACELFSIYSGCFQSDFDQLAEHREEMDRYLTRQATWRAVLKLLLSLVLGCPFLPMTNNMDDLGIGFLSTCATAAAGGLLTGILLGIGWGVAVGLGFFVISVAIGALGKRDWLTRDLIFLYYRARLKMLGADPNEHLLK